VLHRVLPRNVRDARSARTPTDRRVRLTRAPDRSAFSPMMPLKLYPFRYRDPLTGKWVRARYEAELHEIAKRYAKREIARPPEFRRVTHGSFNPFAHAPRPPPHDPPEDPPKEPVDDPPPWEPPPKERPPEETTDLHPLERFLVLVFLRRYVTWCARHWLFAAMDGAAKLARALP
jgi:hypothetical protein